MSRDDCRLATSKPIREMMFKNNKLYECPVCFGASREFPVATDGRHYRQCVHCEATFLIPAQRLSASLEYAHYLRHNNDPADSDYRRFLDGLRQPLLNVLPGPQSGLDYGCGPGPALASMLREAGHSMALYDPYFHNTPAALEITYDFVTCSEVVEHFYRPAEEFSRLDRLIRPGGVLAVMTGMLTDQIRFLDWHYRRDPTHVLFYTPETMKFLARHHSWRCEFPEKNVVLFFKNP